MPFVFHRILINECHDTLLKHFFCDDVLAQKQQLVENGEDLLVEAVGNVAGDTVELVQEEVLEVRIVLLSILTSLDVCEDDVQEFEHRLSGAAVLEVFRSSLQNGNDDLEDINVPLVRW